MPPFDFERGRFLIGRRMDFINDYSDQRNKALCIHCGHVLSSTLTNRDHVPTKTLLHAPLPKNLPVVEVCMNCNASFSLHEQYFVAFLSSVITGSVDPEMQKNPNARKILTKNEKLKLMLARTRCEYPSQNGETRILWEPDYERINHVLVKNARGHAYYELGEPILGPPTSVWSRPIEAFSDKEKENFENVRWSQLWPEIGSRLMSRILEGHDLKNSWIIVQNDIYRYAILQIGSGILVRTVICEYLATEVIWE